MPAFHAPMINLYIHESAAGEDQLCVTLPRIGSRCMGYFVMCRAKSGAKCCMFFTETYWK